MKLNEVLSADLFSQVDSAINDYNAKITDKAKQVKFVDLSEGLYVSKDKHTDKINALTAQNSGLQEQLNKQAADMANLTTQLQAAKTDADKLADVQKSLAESTSQFETAKKEWEQKIATQAYDFAIKERVGKLAFSSKAAEKTFISEAKSQEFKIDGEDLLGFNEWLAKYREADPGAFAAEEKPHNPDSGKSPVGTGNNGGLKPTGFAFNFNGVRPHK